jgi:hypothetical protein
MANYTYSNRVGAEGGPVQTKQKYYGVGVTYNIGRTLMFSVLGELSTIGTERNYRVNTSIIKRFDSKK